MTVILPKNHTKAVKGLQNLTPGVWHREANSQTYFIVSENPRMNEDGYWNGVVMLDSDGKFCNPLFSYNWEGHCFVKIGESFDIVIKN